MLRFISHLFKLNYETCKGCEILKQQLAIANENNNRLEETLIGLLNPKVIEQPIREVPPLKKQATTFTQRREILEAKDRQTTQVLKTSPFVAKPDDIIKAVESAKPAGDPGNIEKLEAELGVEENAS